MGTFVNAALANDYITGRKPMPIPRGTEVVSCRFAIEMEVGDLNTSDIGAFGKLPAGCVPVDVLVDMDDLDTGAAALVLNIGIMSTAAASALSTAAADGGGAWGVTTATNAAATQRMTFTGNNMVNVQADDANDRLVGVLVATGATTPAAGTLGVTVFYKNAD